MLFECLSYLCVNAATVDSFFVALEAKGKRNRAHHFIGQKKRTRRGTNKCTWLNFNKKFRLKTAQEFPSPLQTSSKLPCL